MRSSALLLLVVAVGCGPARVLTRPEGNGGWSEERRASEIAPIAQRARVELDGADAPPPADVNAPLTLDDVVRLAAAESRRLAEADRDVDVAAARVREARGRLFPSVSSQARYSWNTDSQSNTVDLGGGQTRSIEVQEKNYATASGTVSVPIDLFGEITKGLTSAQAGYRAEQARRYATQLDEQVAAVRAYFRLLETQRLRVVDEQTLEAQRQQVKNAQSGVDAGRLMRNELLVAQVAVQSSEQQLRTRDLQIAQSRWDLNAIIGRPIDAPTRVADVAARPALPSAADALRDAYKSNPVLLALVEEQQRLEDAASALSRSRLPSFQGGGTGQWTSAQILQPQELGGGFVGMNWNFDLGGRKDAQIAQARIAADQNRIRIERQLRDVETAVRASRQAAEERLAAFATAESAVRQAEENLRIREQQFAVGRATSEDVLDAEALLAGQRATLATALYQAHTRRAELQQVLGLPLDAILPGPEVTMRSLVLLLCIAGAIACRGRSDHYTGFVEGEERVLRSEVTGRVREVKFAEGDAVPADAVVAVLDDDDVQAKLRSKRQELAVADGDIRTADERVVLTRETWERNLAAAEADVRQAETTAAVAERTLAREADLVKTGASTAQLLDDMRARRDQARATHVRSIEMRERTKAEERSITVAERELETLKARRDLTLAQIHELEVTAAKYLIHAPAAPTVVQTQHIWPGELAQPGAPILAVLDPKDKYVQIYVPVDEVGDFTLGRPAHIELDSRPGVRIPGEVSFVADQANFTPEKIETRSDRMAQVYRVKIRILDGVEGLQPGTEGNVYLDEAKK